MSKLLHNLPIEDLTKENDYLGVIDKAELIKTILESNTDQFHEIKMFTLYGDWGSGKSTLMKYLERELSTSFNTFFFDTWQFEKDENLPKTLLDFLLKKSEADTISKDIVKFAGKLFRGLGKSVKVNVPLFPKGPSVNVNPAEFVKEFEEQDVSFYEALEKFKTEFRRWEDHTTKKKDKKYNIIFIDDLDRCEPENVLNLLSAIKLFFTYGEKTIFFFGVDKKAVQQAIQTKYDDVVKSEEYLEKIFDISFSMPKHESVLKLVSTYFDDRDIEGEKLNERIAHFFRALHFTNPRKLKKVLNKYALLVNIKENISEDNLYSVYIGNIITKKSKENYFETILSLYLIAVKEFYPKLFVELFDIKLKESIFNNASNKSNFKSEKVIRNLQSYLRQNSILGIGLNLIFNKTLLKFGNPADVLKVATIFIPNNISSFEVTILESRDTFNKIYINDKLIDYYFLKYLCINVTFFAKFSNYSTKSISAIYQGIKQIL